MDDQAAGTELRRQADDNESRIPEDEDSQTTRHNQESFRTVPGSSNSHANMLRSTSPDTSPTPQPQPQPPTQPQADQNQEDLTNPHSIQIQARIATVLYDMLIRGHEGPEISSHFTELTNAFPLSAAVARQYATHISETVFKPMQYAAYIQQAMRRRTYVLHRISITSVAMFCGVASAFIASLWLWFVITLAIAATIARLTSNTLLSTTVQFFASPLLRKDGMTRLLYEWVFNFMNQENPIVAIRRHGPMAGARMSFSPDLHITTVFLIPVVIGLVHGIIGGLFALAVNMGLNAIGGIRYESHDD